MVLQMVSDAKGNFYSNQPVSFPVNPMVSGCKGTEAMIDPAPNGSCNGAFCHSSTVRPMYLH
jgi:hypothetical protein